MKHRVVVSLLVVLFAFSVSYADDKGIPLRFRANLSGDEEVPRVQTETSGRIRVEFDEDLTMAEFRLRIRDGERVQQAHFHCAPRGVNGPVIVFLIGNVPAGFDIPDGEVEGFVVRDANIVPGVNCEATIGFNITSVSDLWKAMVNDLIYANVHTRANPGGEVRGQLREDD